MTDIEEAKKCINCLVFAIDDPTVLVDVRRIVQGLVDEVERFRAAAAECSSELDTRPDRHPSPTRAEMVEARNKALEDAARVAADFGSSPWGDNIWDHNKSIAARIRSLTKADSEPPSGEKA